MTLKLAQPLRHAVHAMGTRFEMVAFHEDAVVLRGAMEEAFDEVVRLHALWSPFERSSTIAHVNRGGGGGRGDAVRVDRDTLDLLLASQRLWLETGGLFDPTVGALMQWWGFRGDPDSCGRIMGLPRPRCGMQHVEIDERAGTVRTLAQGIEIDVGAIGKGAALDRAGDVLREAGVGCALLHAGTSSVLGIGTPLEGEDDGSGSGGGGWRVRVGEEADAPVVTLRDESLSVSRPSGRVITVEGGKAGHVLDPRTGEPTRGVSLAAVVCESAAGADAWSTACLVGGEPPPAHAARWAYVLKD